MSYQITIAKSDRGNLHISQMHNAADGAVPIGHEGDPLCGTKPEQQGWGGTGPRDIEQTWDAFDEIPSPIQCKNCWSLGLRLRYSA